MICVATRQTNSRGRRLEVRMDCAFFSDEIISVLEALGIQYTISVPFERFVELKLRCDKRLIWRRCDRPFKPSCCITWLPQPEEVTRIYAMSGLTVPT